MPVRSRRSGSAKRVAVRLPGGRRSVRYDKARGGRARCRICGQVLHGTASSRLHRVSATSRSPSRQYGGNICGSCLKGLLRGKVRSPA